MPKLLQKKKLPDSPGVYFFLGRNKKLLYIGRATSLRSRVRSYFDGRLHETRGPWVEKMVGEAKSIDFKKTDSVLEAILLEADLIKKFQPPYNTREKDDKSFNCVVITDEAFPRVLVVRHREIDSLTLKIKNCKLKITYGPFTSGSDLRGALKIIRKIFPYRDTCEPNQRRPCFNRQIGLCPGVCDGTVSEKEYRRTIRQLQLFFEGKKRMLLTTLKKEMRSAIQREAFEEANVLKNRIQAVTHIQDVSLFRREKNTSTERIESYDIAHTGGKSSVGVMTVVEGGLPNKNEYRLFNLKTTTPGDDVGGLCEVVTRRLAHSEWAKPAFIVVDGGQPQKDAIEEVLEDVGLLIPVIAVKKDARHRPQELLGSIQLIKKYQQAILLANAEAHRFAIGRHRKRRGKDFLHA
ncbi:MAG: GIY-YIG nuclease family protein [bacterium]|nr:GIY-YIG nuclease family protein [bacterium]